MPELLENRTGDLAKSGAKKRIHKIPAHMNIEASCDLDFLLLFEHPKEEGEGVRGSVISGAVQ
jgi:hypothetical protein